MWLMQQEPSLKTFMSGRDVTPGRLLLRDDLQLGRKFGLINVKAAAETTKKCSY